jgi:hypothetical protein
VSAVLCTQPVKVPLPFMLQFLLGMSTWNETLVSQHHFMNTLSNWRLMANLCTVLLKILTALSSGYLPSMHEHYAFMDK